MLVKKIHKNDLIRDLKITRESATALLQYFGEIGDYVEYKPERLAWEFLEEHISDASQKYGISENGIIEFIENKSTLIYSNSEIVFYLAF